MKPEFPYPFAASGITVLRHQFSGFSRIISRNVASASG